MNKETIQEGIEEMKKQLSDYEFSVLSARSRNASFMHSRIAKPKRQIREAESFLETSGGMLEQP